MKPEPVLDLQGPRQVPTPQGPAPSPRRAAPIQQKCLQQLDFAPPTSEGFSSGKERVLIPALPHLPPPPHATGLAMQDAECPQCTETPGGSSGDSNFFNARLHTIFPFWESASVQSGWDGHYYKTGRTRLAL